MSVSVMFDVDVDDDVGVMFVIYIIQVSQLRRSNLLPSVMDGSAVYVEQVCAQVWNQR